MISQNYYIINTAQKNISAKKIVTKFSKFRSHKPVFSFKIDHNKANFGDQVDRIFRSLERSKHYPHWDQERLYRWNEM